MKAKSLLAAVALLAMGAPPCSAQSFPGASALGRALGSGSQTQQRAYRAEQRRMADLYLLRRQAQANQSRANVNQRLDDIRAKLKLIWQSFGYDEAMAGALAAAYHPSDDEEAARLSARGVPPETMGKQIRKALDDHRYLLADQLLMAAVVEAARHKR